MATMSEQIRSRECGRCIRRLRTAAGGATSTTAGMHAARLLQQQGTMSLRNWQLEEQSKAG
jgi:hypothetical protein